MFTRIQKACLELIIIIFSLTACSDNSEPNDRADLFLVIIAILVFCIIFKFIISDNSADVIDVITLKMHAIIDGLNGKTANLKRRDYCSCCGKKLVGDENYCTECGTKIDYE